MRNFISRLMYGRYGSDALNLFLLMAGLVLYLLGTAATFVISTLYHGARPGEAKRFLRLLDHCAVFFAVAGTATSVVSVRERMEVYETHRVHLSVVTREQLDEQFEWMSKLPLEQRRKISGLDPDRAPVVLGGLIILQEAMELLGVDEFTVSECDILQGIVMCESRK